MGILSLLLASIELIAPVGDETVAIIPDGQRTVLTNETLAAREAVLAADMRGDKKLARDLKWRKALPVVFRWKVTDGERGPWEIQLAKKPDFSDARRFLFLKAKADAATCHAGKKPEDGELAHTLEYANLEIATRYFWRVSCNLACRNPLHSRTCDCKDRRPLVSSGSGSFMVEDLAPRWIELEGRVLNFRDLGGRIGLGGKRVRQGLVYRSQGLNENSIDHATKGKVRLTATDVEYLTETLSIRTDLDLRGPGEVAGLNGVSPLGKGVRFVNRSSKSYKGIFTDEGKEIMAANFREFLDRKNYPILFHCIGGADRTGALAYVLNGVLGVKRQELETDWESTFYPLIPDQHAKDPDFWRRESHFNDGFSKYGDEKASWNDRIVLYLKDCGVTDAEIETFRAIMLQ